jgi:hypothetical protein
VTVQVPTLVIVTLPVPESNEHAPLAPKVTALLEPPPVAVGVYWSLYAAPLGAVDVKTIVWFALKRAVTDFAASMVTLRVVVPVPSPLQPLNVEPDAGVAVKVTFDPLVKLAEQVVPQLMPAGLLVTVPLPAPVLLTESKKDATVTVVVLVNVGAVIVALFAALPTTVCDPAVLVTTAPVNVAVPLAFAATLLVEIVLPGVDENAEPPSVVEAAVRKGLLMVALERLNTVITGLIVAPAACVAPGGVMSVISSEYRFRVLSAAIAPEVPVLPLPRV